MSKNPISETKPTGCVGKVCFSVFGIALTIGGFLGLYWVLLKPWLNVQQSSGWPATHCTVVSSEIERHRGDDGDTFSAEIAFVYEVDNTSYRSETYSFYEWSGPHASAQATVDKYPINSKHDCFYDPENPAIAVLDRSFGWGSLIALLFLLMPLLGLFLVYAVVSPPKRKKRRSQLGFANQGGDETVMEHGGDFDKIFAPEYRGPQRLKPENSPAAGLIVSAIILAVLSVVAFFVFKSGGFGFGFFICAAFALCMLAALIYQLLALTNPTIEIAMSNGTLVPGETVDIAWEAIGNTSRIRQLTIAIEAEESAEYTRGTDRITDRNSAFLDVVADLSDSQEMQFGSASFTVPKDAVHSFEAGNNAVTWWIRVVGDIPMWPDVSSDFKFMVQPNE